MNVDAEPPSDAASSALQYILNAKPLHERLQRILTQIAGFSLLLMMGGARPPTLDVPVALAADELRLSREQLRALRVPPAASHHYYHIMQAVTAVDRGIDLVWLCLRPHQNDADRAALTRWLRIASEHLRAAGRLLPGFEMVDLRQACCAAHSEAERPALPVRAFARP